MNSGIYIHIPFCAQKCPYCDFYSVRYQKTLAKRYVDAVIMAIESYCGKKICADTIYFGGGTPNLLGADLIAEIISKLYDCFKISNDVEITLEANPESFRGQSAFNFKAAGINRISMGLQSANGCELERLSRLHSAEDVVLSVKAAREGGIDNISLDLMLGLENQTTKEIKNSIDFCSHLDVEHISAYMLKIEKNTPFYTQNLNLPTDDDAAELYLFAAEYLEEKGYKQYEISNFAKSSKCSKHNLKYWRGEEYIGIGASAHGFENGKRYHYKRDIESFIKNPTERVFDSVGGGIEETFMLKMRLCEGINLNDFQMQFGISLSQGFFKKLELFKNAGLVSKNDSQIHLTKKGFLVSNSVISGLLVEFDLKENV